VRYFFCLDLWTFGHLNPDKLCAKLQHCPEKLLFTMRRADDGSNVSARIWQIIEQSSPLHQMVTFAHGGSGWATAVRVAAPPLLLFR
jgi:hypothetical protein